MNDKSQQPNSLAVPGIFNQVPVGFAVLDAEGQILAVNQLLEKLLATDRQTLLKHHLSEHVVAADRQLLAKHLSQLITVGVAETCKLRIAKPGGVVVWVRLESVVTNDESGQTIIHSVVIDIADHQATAQQLAEKEARLRTVLATIPDMVWLKNPQGVYLGCNKMFERFFGAASSEIIGRTDYDFVDKELADFFRENDYKAITDGKSSMNEETLVFAADGTRAIFETIKTPAYAADGSLIGVLGVARDITERKRMEAALRRNADVQLALKTIAEATLVHTSLEELYATVQRCIAPILPAKNFHINILDENTGKILVPFYVDENNFVSAERPVQSGLAEYTMRLGRAVHLTAFDLERLQQTGEACSFLPGVEEWIGAPLSDADGKIFGVALLYSSDKNLHFHADDVEVIAIVAAQVSQAIEKVKAQAALRLSENRFRQLLETLPLPLTIVNRDGKQEYINDRFIQIFGYTCEEIPTITEWWKQAYPDPDYRQWVVENWTAAVEKAVATGKDVEPAEYNITCKNRLVRPVIVSGVAIGDVVLSTFTDISERRRHERIMKASFERRRKNELMNQLIQTENPSQQVIFESARVMGANIMTPFSCFLFVVDEYRKQGMDYWQNHLTEYHLLLDSVFDALEVSERIVWESPDGIGVVVFEPEPAKDLTASQKKLAVQLRAEVVAKAPGLKIKIGIAELAGSMADFGRCYRQARLAVDSGRKVWPQMDIYHYLDMGVYQLLARFNDEQQIDEYIERVLGNLLQYDNKRKSEVFLDTLAVILMSENMKEAAEKLAIHYQTLLFRKQRIEKILGVSFDDFATKMSLLTALHLLKLRRN